MPSIEDPTPTDADDRAESLDEEVVGSEEPIDPPDRPLGLEDPSAIGDDDVATRAWRTEDELDGIPDSETPAYEHYVDDRYAQEELHVSDEP